MPDPVQNALAAQPSNNLAYIGPTPRNRFMGGIADLLALGYKLPNMPRMGVPGLDFVATNRNRLLDMLGVGDVQKTAETMSYGGRLGTGAGMTYRPLPETLGAAMAVAPMVAPAARMASEGAMATGRFVAPKVGQLAEQYMVNTGGILPLDVYHGSPHTFPPTPKNPLGEFDASKIGTGEGNQSFGHGIYTAENPNVGKGYAEQLSTAQGPLGDVAKYWRNNGGESAFRAFAKDAGLPPAEIESTANVIRNTGNLYKVDLPDEKIAQMLDWDKPLNEQPNILKVLEKNYRSDYLDMFKNRPGSDFYKAISGNEGVEDLRVSGSSELTKLGIPGIKYLDEGSRVKPNITDQKLARLYDKYNGDAEAAVNEMMRGVYNTPKEKEAIRQVFLKQLQTPQTRNFVVFPGEEKSMTILERNGQPAQMSVADQIDNFNEVLKKKRKK